MNYAGAIAVIVLTPILWILAHKYFRFIYFGNIGNSILKEILECFFISFLLVAIFGALLKKLFSFLGKALLFILKLALIIAAVIAVIWLISLIVKKIKSSKGSSNSNSEIVTEPLSSESADDISSVINAEENQNSNDTGSTVEDKSNDQNAL